MLKYFEHVTQVSDAKKITHHNYSMLDVQVWELGFHLQVVQAVRSNFAQSFHILGVDLSPNQSNQNKLRPTWIASILLHFAAWIWALQFWATDFRQLKPSDEREPTQA